MPESRPEPRYDIAVIGDFRFPGGTSAAVAEEIEAQAAAGYRTALVQLKGPVLKFPHPFHPRIRACIDAGLAELVDPDAPIGAGLAIAHHPALFAHPPRRGLRIAAAERLLIVHHPPFDGIGEPSYDWRRADRVAAELLGGELVWAPIGPAVRSQLESLDEPPTLLGHDWYNVLDPSAWRAPRGEFRDTCPVIGRHSRPDPLKWPDSRDEVLAAYPEDPRFLIRVLGGGPYLRELVGPYPRNWQVWPFNAMPAARFLGMIDFFVYFHHSRWVEAFGRTIIEAMASGAVAILPPHFRPLFGDAALYADAHDAPQVSLALRGDPAAYREASRRGQDDVRRRFSHKAHVSRLREVIGRPRRQRIVAPARRAPMRVLLMSSNGVGMGHLTRLLAIARRLPPPLEPVFLTLSQALKVIQDQGYLAEYLPYHAYLGADVTAWNRFLHQELNELISFYGPRALIFDGHMPYGGLMDALKDNPDLWSGWCRRGMWGAHHRSIDAIRRESSFDAVIEPRDLAGAYDDGITVEHRSRTRMVEPIRLLDPEEIMGRDEARRELGLKQDRLTVLLQLGSGNNYDYRAVRKLAVDRLRRLGDVQVAIAQWMIAEQALDVPDDVLKLSHYPLSRYLPAFDFVISAVGYNSFHEIVSAQVPAVFVPNEHPQQDNQLGRARYAERHGFGFCVRTSEVYRLAACIDALLDPAERRRLRDGCAALAFENGAIEAARFIEEMAYGRRIDRA
jgi:hypothetical protein